MINISLDGDAYILNITLPANNFNYELLHRVCGLVHKSRNGVHAGIRTTDIKVIHKMTERLLILIKLLEYE